MGLECVYPENQGRKKQQQKNENRRKVSLQTKDIMVTGL